MQMQPFWVGRAGMKIDLDHAYGYTSRALPPATDWADHACGAVS